MDVAGIEALEAAVQAAEDMLRAGDFADAYRRYRELVARRLESAVEPDGMGAASGLVAADMVLLERLADLAGLFGEDAAAEDILAAMALLYRQAGNRLAERYTLLKRLQLGLGAGRLDRVREGLEDLEANWVGDLQSVELSPSGLQQFERALDWQGCAAGDREVLLSRLHLVLGWWLAANGQYGDAAVVLNRALVHCAQNRPPAARDAVLPIRLHLARARLEQGDLGSCGSDLEAVHGRTGRPHQAAFHVEWLELRAKLALLRGDYPQALTCCGEIVEFCRERSFSRAHLVAQLNLAHALIIMNHTQAGRRILAVMDEVARQRQDAVVIARIRLLEDLALARARSMADGVSVAPAVSLMWGRRSAAPAPQPALARARPYAPQAPNFLDFFDDRALAVQLALGERDTKAAAELVSCLADVFDNTDSMLIRTRLQVLRGMVHYYEGRCEQAEAMFAAAGGIFESQGLLPELWQALRMQGWCAERLGRNKEDVQRIVARAAATLDRIAGGLSAADRAVFLLNKWTAEEEYLAGEVNKLARLKRRLAGSNILLRPFLAWSLRRATTALLVHVETSREMLASDSAAEGSAAARPPTKARNGRLALLPADRALVAFLVLPDRVVVFRVAQDGVTFGVTPVSKLELRQYVGDWYRRMTQSGSTRDLGAAGMASMVGGPESQAMAGPEPPSGRSLAELLQLPSVLETLPDRVRSLVFVPDDVLSGFPFAAILHQGRPLVESYAISVAFSALRKARPSSQRDTTLMVAVSQGARQISWPRGTAREVAPLPGTAREIAALKPWFERRTDRVEVLADAQAGKSAVVAAMRRARFIHFAAHGVFLPDTPDQSGLILVPSPDAAEVLSLRELSELDLAGVRHVTLSSCWSADNYSLPGRRILGLPETLWRAGAESVLGCLWPVDDEVAVAFMSKFHEHLERNPRDQALRLTQLDCLTDELLACQKCAKSQDAGRSTRNPFLWAGFTLYGDSSRLPSRAH